MIFAISDNIPGGKPVSIYQNSGLCFSRALIGYSTNEYPALFTDSPPVPPSERRQPETRGSCEQNAFLVCCRNKQRNFTTNQISKLFPKYTKKVTKFGLEVLTGKALSFWFELSIKPVKRFFVYKCKLSLSLALLYSVDLFIYKHKTKFNNPFYRMILNTKRIHNSF